MRAHGVLINDTDSGQPATDGPASSNSPPTAPSASTRTASLRLCTPMLGFYGTDFFRYTAQRRPVAKAFPLQRNVSKSTLWSPRLARVAVAGRLFGTKTLVPFPLSEGLGRTGPSIFALRP